MKTLASLICLLTLLSPLNAQMHHHDVVAEDVHANTFYWQQDDVQAFDELLISWNAFRPTQGHFSIYISVKTDTWSDYLPYAKWGANLQAGNKTSKEGAVRIFQDAVDVLDGKVATAFKLKIVAEKQADITQLKSVHICANKVGELTPITALPNTSFSSQLNVAGLSQMALSDARGPRLCSPTSTASVVGFLRGVSVEPIGFAENCLDATFDIFGNWVFNVAAAFDALADTHYSCWVDRVDCFDTVLNSLKEESPVVISIRGPLKGSAQPYKSGHLIAIIGYDATANEVICMDPAFESDEKTIVRYAFDDLMTAWHRRGNIAYLFKKR